MAGKVKGLAGAVTVTEAPAFAGEVRFGVVLERGVSRYCLKASVRASVRRVPSL